MTALKKILVVDDDPVVGISFDRVLSGKGYAVITARDGEEALDKLAREDYDAVFTDLKMPGMSGIEVAARVKAARPWLPVVIVTGYGSEANEAKAREAGVAAFLRKPLSPEMIEDSAQAAVLENKVNAAAQAIPVPAGAPVTLPTEWQKVGGVAKNVGLFLAAPFIGLAYVVALPIVGLGLLALYGFRALAKRGKSA
jgi:CheY-like chemotaxis protein